MYAPDAAEADGCGPERYRVGVRTMLGADLDPDEMYEWAWTDFHHLREEIATTCEQILPGASFAEVIDLLDTDPARAEHSEDAYQQWLQALTDEALARSKEHFEIPDVMDRCEALIPPAGSAAAAYYTGPSEDFTRPGRTWYPALGRTMFPRWGDVTTCYHESVPGHHLQIAYAKVQAASLSRIQRSSFIPGHGEGWALYAEQLCDEFGWFDNPDYRLGFLGGQILRTVRVIIDIGMHLGKRIPDGTTLNDGTPFHGGETWTPDLAFEFSVNETGNTETFMRSEIDRYLGWPAQAISYKIGQREWVAARDDARARDGDDVRPEGMAHEGVAARCDRPRPVACRARPIAASPARVIGIRPASGLHRAEEADDAQQLAGVVELHDVDTADRDRAVGTDEVPSVAGEAVVRIDCGRALEAVAGEVRQHGIGERADLGVAATLEGRIDAARRRRSSSQRRGRCGDRHRPWRRPARCESMVSVR